GAGTSTPFARALASVASTAAASTSTATTGAKPSLAAAIESTPEPQPTSRMLVGRTSCSSSRQSRVVGWAPVPKARPGSITTASTAGGGTSQGGPTQRRPTTT